MTNLISTTKRSTTTLDTARVPGQEQPIVMIRPLHDRILAQRVDEQTRTSGGLFIPDKLHVGAGILGDQDLVARLDRGRLDRSVREQLAASDRNDHRLERLLLCVVGNEQAAGRAGLLVDPLGEDANRSEEQTS